MAQLKLRRGMLAGVSLMVGIVGLLLVPRTSSVLADSPTAKPSMLTFIRLYTDASGASHFSSETLPLAPVAGGQGMEAVMSSEDAAAHLLWMATRPNTWTGNTVGFADISDQGGP